MVHTWNPKAEKAETERVLGLTDSHVNFLANSRTVKTLSQKERQDTRHSELLLGQIIF